MSSPTDPGIPDHIKVRVEGAKDHGSRSRSAFLASTLISLAILVSVYNAYFSWHRDFALNQNFVSEDVSSVTREAQRQVLMNWAKSQWVTIAPLGIQVGVADMAVVGSLALMISSMWLYYSIRRENHAIGDVLRDSLKEPPLVRQYAYHGIAAGLVFASLSEYDDPVTPDLLEDGAARPRMTATPIRQLMRGLIFLPPVTVFFTILADILTVVAIKGAFRFPHEALWGRLGGTDLMLAALMMTLATTVGLFLWRTSSEIARFQVATINLMRAFNQKFDEIESIPPGKQDVRLIPWLTSSPPSGT